MDKMKKDWILVKDNNQNENTAIDLLEPHPIKWEESLTSGSMGYNDLFEKIGPQIGKLKDSGFKKLEKRWGKFIILFPGTQCKDTEKNIFVPSLKCVRRMPLLGQVSHSWEFEWFSLHVHEKLEQMGRLGAMGILLDVNNIYDGIAILVPKKE